MNRLQSKACHEALCYYCGCRASSWDHIIPWSLEHQNEEVVPACMECNSLLHNQMLLTPELRGAYIHSALKQRYEKIMGRAAYWADAGMDDLGETMRAAIEQDIDTEAEVMERLAWSKQFAEHH